MRCPNWDQSHTIFHKYRSSILRSIRMNPIESPVQKPLKKGSSGHQPRLLKLSKWVFSGIVSIFLLLTLIVVIVLHTKTFHNYALNKVRSLATQQLGAQVDLQNFTLNLSRLSLDIYGLTLHGAVPYTDPPLLQIQHAAAAVRIVSILHRKWYLDRLQVDGPVAKVFTDANGNTNIPKLKSSGNKNNTNVFDLGIRHAAVSNGEVYYNDRHSAVAADLHDVEFRSAFNTALQKYSGTLSYRDGHLVTGSTQTFQHDLNAAFDATPSTFHFAPATLTTGGSKIVLFATVQNYSDPDVEAQYDVIVDGRDVRGILANPSIPAGLIHASGSARYHTIPNRPALDAVVLNGNLSSQQLDIQTPSLRSRISDVAVQYSLANGNATLQFLRARLLGGKLEATGKMTAVGADSSHSEVNASLRGVSLGDLQAMLRTSAMPKNVAITGAMNSQLKAAWGKTIQDLIAQADATLDGRVSGSTNGPTTVIPLNAAVHGKYSNASQQMALMQSYVRTPQTLLTMNGVMSKHSNVALKLQVNDLREIETVADLFRTPAP